MLGPPLAGKNWKADVYQKKGLIDNANFTGVDIGLEFDSVKPYSNLNIFGGDTLTIRGKNFGTNPDFVRLTFNDGSECIPTTVIDTELTCVT